MLKAGAEVNELDEFGYAPLHRAVLSGRVPLVRLLFKRQADPNLLTRVGQTALDLCRYPKNQKLENMIIGRGEKHAEDLPTDEGHWQDK